jgi:hypothetical protein
MPMFYKPGFIRYKRVQGKEIELPGVVIDGTSLGEFLWNVERITGEYMVPAEPPKYFKYYTNRYAKDHLLVDLHVERGNEWVCPKQDLSFPLLESDVVSAGELEC